MKRHLHKLSNYKNATFDMGELVPMNITEVLPGDVIQQSTSMLMRVTPLLRPVMHPVHVFIRHWFVPSRLLWDNFQSFITGGEDGADASVFPTVTISGGATEGSLADYLGVPVTGADITVNALPFRAYNLIFNEFYRDQDVQTTKRAISTADGADSTTDVTLDNARWAPDRFTRAKPWTQKGTAVSIPLGTKAPVVGDAFPMKLESDDAGQGELLYNSADNSLYVGNRPGS